VLESKGRAFAHVMGPAVLRSSSHSKLVRQVGSLGAFLRLRRSNWSEPETRSSVGCRKQKTARRARQSFSRSKNLGGGASDLWLACG
jgi:hypothetical protein